MNLKNKKPASFWSYSFLIIGSVIGAGFASGKEIEQFFSRFGWGSLTGCIIFGIILFWVTDSVFKTTNHYKIPDLKSFNKLIFKDFVIVVDIILLIVFAIASSGMLAGCTSLYVDIIKTNMPIISIITCVATYFIILGGIDRIIKVSNFFVPFLILIFLINIVVLIFVGEKSGSISTLNFSNVSLGAFFGLLFTCSNILPAYGVLVVAGKNNKSKKIPIFISIVICFFIIITTFVLSKSITGDVDLPLLLLSKNIGISFYYVYAVGLFLALITTFIIGVYNISVLTQNMIKNKYIRNAIIIVIMFSISLIGFGNIVKFMYPVAGALGIIYTGVFLIEYYKMKKNDKINNLK